MVQITAKTSAKAIMKMPVSKPAHPTTAKMVVEAISSLKERKGSSVAAIKKYIAGNFIVDADKLLPFIKRYIKSAVADKTIIQAKGTSLSGSFKLAKSDAKSVKKPVVEKRAKKEKVSKATGEKSTSKKTKSPAPKKRAAAKKPAIPKSPKPSKEKKAGVKSPVAAKPRIPKPKKPTSAPVTKKTKK